MIRRCPICNTVESTVLKHMKMELPENVCLPKEYDIVACDRCGFSYARTDGVTQENYNQYYSVDNDYSDEEIRINVNKELNAVRIELMKKYVSPDSSILDIGCGNGDFLVELKESGYKNLKGIDPGKDSVEVVKKRGINAQVGNIFGGGESESEKYDVVCCTEVLEHIYDLKGCLEKLKGRLKGRGSQIFVDVPGMEGINKCFAMPAENFNCEHINYFTFRSLDNLFCINGFKRISKTEDFYLFSEKMRVFNIGAVYEWDESVSVDLKKDTENAGEILQYFSKKEEQVWQKNALLRETLKGEKQIIVWGGGNYAFQMLASVPEIKGKIVFFVDSNRSKHGRMITGKEIKGIDAIPEDGTLVLICSMNYADEMAEECKKRGVRYYIY